MYKMEHRRTKSLSNMNASSAMVPRTSAKLRLEK